MGREVLKKARKEKGITQPVVAKHLGISLRHYQCIEASDRKGGFDVWDSLEDLFSIHQRELRVISEIHHGKEGSPEIHQKYPQS